MMNQPNKLIYLGGLFDLDKKKEDIVNLEIKLTNPDIWNNLKLMNKYNLELSTLKKTISRFIK